MSIPLYEIKSAPKGKPVNIYLYSYGGDPRSGLEFIKAMKGRKTTCYAEVAGGPAFTILQACTIRIIGKESLIGQTTSDFRKTKKNKYKIQEGVLDAVEDSMELESDRLGIKLKDYKKELREGIVLTKENAIQRKGADAIRPLYCASHFKSNAIVRFIMVGPAKGAVVISTCPIDRYINGEDNASEISDIMGIPILPNESH
jgi:hypothetical protein